MRNILLGAGLALLLAGPASASGWLMPSPAPTAGSPAAALWWNASAAGEMLSGATAGHPDFQYDSGIDLGGSQPESYVFNVGGIDDFWRDLDKITATPPKKIGPKGLTLPEVITPKKLDQITSMKSAQNGWIGVLTDEAYYQPAVVVVY
ncbi:hypothetical protein PRN20_22315 [Devosia sp. ZB163]|uniref:hypothetical protein n=1 Tax=Devosia sp. ZB163 TaxID=3025938 RepID=UPI00235E41C2|nr:hypothetical protein [Devosia sp. ZB163]MDC9826481.1 hypothetical protein [Devosia sp. ZB163]